MRVTREGLGGSVRENADLAADRVRRPSGPDARALGQPVTHLLPTLLQRFRVSAAPTACVLYEFAEALPLQKRVLLDEEAASALADHASAMAPNGVPFWHGVLLSACNRGVLPELFTSSSGALFHQRPVHRTTVSLGGPLSEVLGQVENVVQQCPKGHLIAMASQLALADGEPCHLPMLDFSIRRSDAGKGLATSLIEALGMSGWLVESGNSYHFYGDTLLSPNRWVSFCGNALLLSPLVDGRWLAHQLLQGYSALRISPRGHVGSPVVAARVTSR